MSKLENHEKLVKSYVELEKEFTKKCQTVSKLQKELEQCKEHQDILQSSVEIDPNCQNPLVEATNFGENDLEQTQSGTSEVSPPLRLGQMEFFAAFPVALDFKEEILHKVSDPIYSELDDAFVRCFIDLLISKIVSPSQLAEQEHFLQQYIIPNPIALEKILQAVQCSGQFNSPVTISGNTGNMSLALPTRPKTIEEASELAKKYFK